MELLGGRGTRVGVGSGVKFHSAQNLMFRRNVVRHTRHGNGIWLDSGDVNCRIASNIFADTSDGERGDAHGDEPAA